MKYYSTCRFCKKTSFETNEGMFRYATRHWAHWSCAVDRWEFEDTIAKLNPYQLKQVPWVLFKDHPARELHLQNVLAAKSLSRLIRPE